MMVATDRRPARRTTRRLGNIAARVFWFCLVLAVLALMGNGVAKRGPTPEQVQAQQVCEHRHNKAQCIHDVLNARHKDEER
jgi:hypothetical protein